MGFSQYCPSSLDLTNFVVRECRGATAEECASRSKSAQAWPRPRSGNLEIWGPGNPEILDPTNEKNENLKNLKIQIRSAQNVGKVWISRNKILLAPFGPIPGHFFHGPEQFKKCTKFCLFSLVGQWALFTRFGVMCWCHIGNPKHDSHVHINIAS